MREAMRDIHEWESSERADEDLELLRSTLAAVRTALSHDLRSPLRAIDGFSRVLRSDYTEKLDGDGLDLLDRSVAASDRIGRMVDALIGHVRLTQAVVTPSPLNLSALAFEVADDLRAAYPDVTIEIEADLVAYGDQRLIRRALELLLRVACERTASVGSGLVRFAPDAACSDRDSAAFLIEDCGPLIDPGALAHAFEPFAFTSSTDHPDLGWGDARLIVLRHGGTMDIESPGGRITTVRFALPKHD